jgi:microsomal dipeptidase-like Zn-dependent dipeptidase
VRAGKLALILGVEVDNLGNFNFADAERSESAVRSEIRRLYSKGVRYLFPIHLTDNSFGGSAVAGDLFHVAQRFNEAQPLQADPADWKPGEGFQIENASDDPLLHFHLKAPLDEETLKTIRIALHFAEGFPFPWPGTHPHTVGGKLSQEREYQILKRFFLTPTPIPNVPGPHRNQKGLSDLGHAAMSEMMRLGMLIDIDHMSEYSVQSSLEHAREITEGGYPLFSGHNSFRTLAQGEVTENSRSDVQLASLRELGGMMGVGYEYVRESGPGKSAALALKRQGVDRITHSAVPADCGGSSKSFAQNYLYAVEKIGTVGFGSDVNGIIKGPGPRFGKWSELRGNYCPPLQQTRPVRYARAAGVREWSGPNLPLLALQTGKRVWDVNTDGVPHYGLLPDFIKDLRNVGVTPEDLDPLFSGAENLARTWGRAVSASSLIRGE